MKKPKFLKNNLEKLTRITLRVAQNKFKISCSRSYWLLKM